MTKAERTERNCRINLMHARGAPNANIAEAFSPTDCLMPGNEKEAARLLDASAEKHAREAPA